MAKIRNLKFLWFSLIQEGFLAVRILRMPHRNITPLSLPRINRREATQVQGQHIIWNFTQFVEHASRPHPQPVSLCIRCVHDNGSEVYHSTGAFPLCNLHFHLQLTSYYQMCTQHTVGPLRPPLHANHSAYRDNFQLHFERPTSRPPPSTTATHRTDVSLLLGGDPLA